MSSLMADYSGRGDGAPDNPRRQARAVRPRTALHRGVGPTARPPAGAAADRRPAPVVAVDAGRAGSARGAARAEAERALPRHDADALGPARTGGWEPARAHPDRVGRGRTARLAAPAG